jgi:hypothetical protein
VGRGDAGESLLQASYVASLSLRSPRCASDAASPYLCTPPPPFLCLLPCAEDAWQDLKIAQALTADELADPSLIHRREKLRLAAEAGTEVNKVTAFLESYEQVRGMHRWIKGRRTRGLPVPATLEELQASMMADRTGLPANGGGSTRGKPRTTRGMLIKQFGRG